MLQVQITLAAEQSYRVNRVEEVLDLLHQDLWRTLMDYQEDSIFSIMLMTQIIEAFEKSANIIEEAAELVRVIAIKHNI